MRSIGSAYQLPMVRFGAIWDEVIGPMNALILSSAESLR